jgi:hypothetical protein
MAFIYRETVLTQLLRHGVKPNPETPPALVHDFINDLYLYEIRSLKKRMLEGNIPRAEYSEYVRRLRDSYPVLGFPVQLWTED